MISARRAVSVSAAALLTAGLLTIGTDASAAAPACSSDVFFVGIRGSGQDPGMGDEVQAVLDGVRAASKGRKITAYALPYHGASVPVLLRPVVGVRHYTASIADGTEKLRWILKDRMRRCKRERLVLAGYSQGAMVIHRVLQDIDETTAERIDAVGLIGDGDRLPDDRVTYLGSASTRAKGVGQTFPGQSKAQASRLPASMRGRVHSLCNTKDIVCDFSPAMFTNIVAGNAAIAVHLAYIRTRAIKPLVAAMAAAMANRQSAGSLTVQRPSGPAGFFSNAAGITCPSAATGRYMHIVSQGAGQQSYGWFGSYDGRSTSLAVATDPAAVPGKYTAKVYCAEGTDPSTGDNLRVVRTFSLTQTVTAVAPVLQVTPSPAPPGSTISVGDGGGCGAYPTVAQQVQVSVFDAVAGGSPAASVSGSVTAAGRWGPVKLNLPAGDTTSWKVVASCWAASSDSSDGSGFSYGQGITVPAQ